MTVFDLQEYNEERLDSNIPADVGYNKSNNSLIFDSFSTQYMTTTPSIVGNRRTWTFSIILKRSVLGTAQTIFKSGGSVYVFLGFDTNNRLQFNIYNGSTQSTKLTSAVHNDTSSYYHITAWCDTTQAIASERMGLNVNGIDITSFQTDNVTFSQNYETTVNSTNIHYIGSNSAVNQYLDSIITKCILIDGSVLSSTSFGKFTEYDVWINKPYNGPFGTNGFKLEFNNPNNLGLDSSGNGNDWVPINFTPDNHITDTWSKNYCTLNPVDLSISATPTLTDGSLTVSYASNSGYPNAGATFSPMGRKGYFEVTVGATSNFTFGFLANTQVRSNSTYTVDASVRFSQDGALYKGLTAIQSGYLSAIAAGETVGFAFDFTGDNRNVWIRNASGWGNRGGVGVPETGSNPGFTSTELNASVYDWMFGVNNGGSLTLNFGQTPFTYSIPYGFKTLNSANEPFQTIPDGSDNFGIITWTGDGNNNRFISTPFDPDFIWIKARTGGPINHVIHDRIRGNDKGLITNLTNTEIALTGYFSFVPNGIEVSYNGSGGPSNEWNTSGVNYVAWCWKAGGTGVSNTNGTIASTVSVNQQAGMSVVTYTGNGVDGATVGHGLSNNPDMIIIKKRINNTGINNGTWIIQHKSLTAGVNTDETKFTLTSYTNGAMYLNLTHAQSSYVYDTQVNGNTDTFVAYCFTGIEGYSKFGSYTGNGSADGPFVWCGFNPRWIMIKRTDSSTNGEWIIKDTIRNAYNPMDSSLLANSNSAEFSSGNNPIDALSNGFKLRAAGGSTNINGGTYIFAAFAEYPFAGRGIYPANAR